MLIESLKDGAKTARIRALTAERAFAALTDKSTRYARAIEKLIRAHHDAEAVYLVALDAALEGE